MKAITVMTYARRLRKNCELALEASQVGVHRIGGHVQVGDLPPFTYHRIGASSSADYLADALRTWIEEQRPVPPRLYLVN